MKTIHCSYCSQGTKLNASGRVIPHAVGDRRCVGSGAPEGDLHAATARRLGVSRRVAKAFNFWRLYGDS